MKGMKYDMSVNMLMALSEIGGSDSPLLKLAKEMPNKVSDMKELDKPFNAVANKVKGAPEAQETKLPIQNKIDGLRREGDVHDELKEKNPAEKGYKIESEVYLRDENSNIMKDPVTGEARRIDFVVTKDGKVVDSVEVTSKTADKTAQLAKEERIRENGGNYIKDSEGNLLRVSDDIHTRVERRN